MSSYTPQSPNLSAVPAYAPQSPAVPQSAASYYPPQDSFALPHSSHYDYSAGHAFPHYAQQSFQQPHLLQPPQPMAAAAPDEQKPAPGELENIDVKTKFPVARIKRIVQADEEVGKVAQVTPVVVSKALELFMISLALASAEQAKARNSKRVTGAHLKLAVAKDEQFDFLSDITEKIADAPAASKESKSKRRSDSVDPIDDMDDDAAPKKKGRGRRKKVKSSDDDDED